MADNQKINEIYKINTDNLTVGQIFKNQRELSEYLNQPYSPNGGSKKAQLKEWKRYIDWEKDGNKMIITEIHSSPLDKNDGRLANGTQTYQKFIEDILLAYLDSAVAYSEQEMNNTNEENTIKLRLTTTQIMRICGMVNDNYINKNIKSILLDMDYSIFNINDFFSRTKSKFRTIIDNALSNMSKRKIINYQKNIVIVDNNVQRIADDEEEDIITNIEKQVLMDMGFESIVDVFLSYKSDEYHKKVDKYLKDNFNWDCTYRCYTIRVNRLRINLEKQFLQNTNQQNKLELNKKLTDFFNNQVKRKIIKSNEQKLNGFKLPPNYKSQQTSLSDFLLNIENVDIL